MMNVIHSLLLVAIVGFAHLAQAAPAMGSNNTVIGANATYNVVDIVWNVTINNTNAPYNVTATGTIQDALNKMSLFDPVGAATINNSVLSNDTTTTTATNSSSASGFNNPSTRPREDYVATVRSCNNIAGGTASNRRIQEGIAYLGTVSGTPVEGPGPGACGRVSCSYGGAIYWCNDNLETKVLSSFSAIGDGAQLLVDHCSYAYERGVNGQQFYDDGWNVIVKYESC